MKKLALLLLLAMPAFAQSLTVTPRGVVIAHDRIVELFDAEGKRVWSGDGVAFPGAIASDDQRVAVVDPLANVARVIDLASGKGTTIPTGETPIAAAFVKGRLYVLARDARLLERLDGTRASIPTGADPHVLRVVKGTIYLYSRLDGTLQEIAPETFTVKREAKLAPFATDIETDTRHLFAAYPMEGKVRTYSVKNYATAQEHDLGARPADLAIASLPNLITAGTLAVADPATKNVIVVEGKQGVVKAFGRGFIRGFLGIRLFGDQQMEAESGVDRVVLSRGRFIGYDSATGTLYRMAKKNTVELATSVGPHAYAVSDEAVFWWDGKALRQQRF